MEQNYSRYNKCGKTSPGEFFMCREREEGCLCESSETALLTARLGKVLVLGLVDEVFCLACVDAGLDVAHGGEVEAELVLLVLERGAEV